MTEDTKRIERSLKTFGEKVEVLSSAVSTQNAHTEFFKENIRELWLRVNSTKDLGTTVCTVNAKIIEHNTKEIDGHTDKLQKHEDAIGELQGSRPLTWRIGVGLTGGGGGIFYGLYLLIEHFTK